MKNAVIPPALRERGGAMRPLLRTLLLSALTLCLFGGAFALPASAEETTPHPGMLRHPDVSASEIVFSYADDLWVVPREGGLARPLASPPGQELTPRFSEDGRTIAFQGNYDGDRDLYTLPVEGGVPYRVTHHPTSELLADWAPDGRLLFSARGMEHGVGAEQLWFVSPEGGLPERLPVPYGAKAAISPDGTWLAYTPHSRDERTWKRYRGGMATDIWLFNLETKAWKPATEWEGTDTEPMWHGDKLYYLSDAGPAHRRNVWVYDPISEEREQITRFEDFDIRSIAMGPGANGEGEIVLQAGAELYLLDLATREQREVRVRIPGARPTLRPRPVDAARFIYQWNLSPSGARALAMGRGDVWTLPAEKGSPRNLTRTTGVAERSPAWSPDGKHVAWFSDATGEYELYVAPADGRGAPRRLTSEGELFRTDATWSPDSKHILIQDNAGHLDLVEVESGEKTRIAKDGLARSMPVSWSSDSRYLAFDHVPAEGSSNARIMVYDTKEAKLHQLTSGMFSDTHPVFDREGKYLFFSSNRHFSPLYGEVDTSFLYAGSEVMLVATLKADTPSPFAPKSDEEEVKDEKKKGDDEKAEEGDEKADKKDGKKGKKSEDEGDEGKDEKKKPAVEIEVEGFESRAVALPVDPGVFGTRAVNDKGQLLYVRGTIRGMPGDPSIKLFDLGDDEKKEKDVASDVGGFILSADGKKILYPKRGRGFIQNAAAGAEKDAKPVVTDGMNVMIAPREEWQQVFTDAWRRMREYFYDPTMHGVDWEAVRDQYMPMLADAVTRNDVSFIIREMISELNVGHAYYRSGPSDEQQPSMPVGMLGADFALENGAYRITKILGGGAWDSDARGPLGQPGLDVKEGDYLLAVNGVPVDTSRDPWAAFLGTLGRAITLTLSDKPELDEDAREVVVEPAASEFDLRYRDWVEQKRRHVEEKSEGRIAYIHVPNTGIRGQNELVRQFFQQNHLPGMIIDDRWNGGGQIPTRFIELLNRPLVNMWALRHGRDWPWPPDAHHGPKAMLINGLAGSGGDAFPAYFRQAGLGKLVGMRTWGGLVGISGGWPLIDGAFVTAPGFAYYELDGTWGIEGHGVDPDVEVVDDPSKMIEGGDPQLDAAIAVVEEELRQNPPSFPERPAYPDRSGMGITEEDK